MPLASILLAILSFACAVLGFLTTPIPGLGAVFSFAAPALAIAGSVVGGLAMSRAKREGTSTDVARTGVILSAIAFVPALLIALFCGVCNALCATGEMHMQKHVSFGVDPNAAQTPQAGNAGAQALPPPPRLGVAGTGAPAPEPNAPAPGAAPDPNSPAPDPNAPTPGAVPPPSAAPPSAFPPPPLPPGPGTGRKPGR